LSLFHFLFTVAATSEIYTLSLTTLFRSAPQGGGLDWPSLITSKIGNGGNLINDWEWIAYYSNLDYSLAGNVTVNAVVSVTIPTSEDNISFKTGYVVANSVDGLSSSDRYGSFFPGCLRVEGTGDLIYFCNPQLSAVDPRTSLDNDIITLYFDPGVTANALEDETEIYLCA